MNVASITLDSKENPVILAEFGCEDYYYIIRSHIR
jgi:hypothetical protein